MTTLDKEFKSDLKLLLIPSILQMLIGNSFSFIDTLMIGGLGETAIAAMSAAGQFSFVFGMILSAIYGVSSFITQFYGKDDWNNIHKSLGLMLVSSVLVSVVGAFIVLGFREPIMGMFINEEQAILYGIQYLNIIVFVYIINAVRDSYKTALDSIGQIKINLYIGLIGMIINTILNYLLIYGKFGFPKLGIQGAALATLISSAITMMILIVYVYRKKFYVNSSIKQLLSFDIKFVKEVYRKTLPLMFHEMMWSVGNMLYAVAFGYMGVTALASFQLAKTFQNYFMMGVFGFAYAARIMIGKKLSSDNPDEAIIYAQKFTKLAIYTSIIIGGLVIVFNPLIVGLFGNVSQEVRVTFRNILYIQAFLLIANFLNNVWIVGVFRSGGDNLFTMKLIIVTTWFISLPLVLLGAYVFNWSVEIIYIMFALEEVTKAIIGFYRYRSNKWVNNLVDCIVV